MEALGFIPDFYDRFLVFALVFARISSLLMMISIFRKVIFSTRIIMAVAVILSLYVLINDPGMKQLSNDLYSVKTVYSIFYQVLIGVMSAFVVNLIFEIILFMGQIISTQIGLNLISVLDPGIGMVSGISHFYLNVAIILFLSMNGHLFLIETITQSFKYLPIYHVFNPSHLFYDILMYAKIIFSGSILIAMTIIVTMMLTNLSLAVMTKFAPQFNIFSIGIILLLLIGLMTVYVNFSAFTNDATFLIKDGLAFFSNLLLSMR